MRSGARGRRLSALLIAGLAAAAIAAAPAQSAVSRDGWGFAVADDDWEWDDPGHLPSLGDGFAGLAPKAFRFQMIWNAADKEWHMDRARTMIGRAREQGVQQIVVTFKKSVGEDVDPAYESKPTADGYAEHVGEVVRQLADDVDVWGPANEPNLGEAWLPGEAGAELLAQYYARLEQIVDTWDPSAEITSPDFVDRRDLGTIGRYVRSYVNAGGGWGEHVAWHPYWGAHAETTQTTLDLIELAPPGADVWVTEVGAFGRDQGAIEADEIAQNDKVWWLAETLADLPQVERIHYYHMRGSPTASWDTGLMNVDATPRIAWHTWCAMSRGPTHAACQPVTPRSAAPPPAAPPPPSDSPPLGPPPAPSPSPPIASSIFTPSEPSAFDLPPASANALPAAPTSPDWVRPTLRIERVPRRLSYADFADGFALRVRSSEPTALKLDVTVAGPRGRGARPRRVLLARRALPPAGNARIVRLAPRLERLPARRRFVVRVRIRATDSSGQSRTLARRVRVTRR